MSTEKLTPVEHALVAAAELPPSEAQKVLMTICENGIKPKEKENDAHD